MMDKYYAVYEYKMDKNEEQAFRIAVTWDDLIKKLFPDRKITTLPKKGDPRKSTIFKYCWKLLRETRGLLSEDEYKLYISANLTIIKLNNGRVDPNVLCGDKAWVRWKVWKRWYDRKEAERNDTPPPPSVTSTDPKIVHDLDRTKRFLFEKCDGIPSVDKLKTIREQGSLKMWVMSNKISPFYLLLSPFISKLYDEQSLEEEMKIDLTLYREKVSEAVKKFFEYEFKHEFEVE